ncbi:MAG: hypothetical protein WBW58_00700, partial [Candidatus Acidiferrum sp.]
FFEDVCDFKGNEIFPAIVSAASQLVQTDSFITSRYIITVIFPAARRQDRALLALGGLGVEGGQI